MNGNEKYLVLKGSHDLLLEKVERYEKEIESLKMALWSCRYHAQSIIEKDYSESMDAHSIVNEVNRSIGE